MKKKLVILIVTLVVILGGGLSYYFWNKSNSEKAYHSQLIKSLDDMEYSMSEAASIGNAYQKYWGKIIDGNVRVSAMSKDLGISEAEIEPLLNWSNSDNYYGSIGKILEKGNIDTMITIVQIAKSDKAEVALNNFDIVTENLSLLKNPPAKFEHEYKTILELYESYNTFISISTSPTGSYIEYSKKLNATYETVQSKLKTAKIQIQ